jgi:hypothetical protein
MIDHIALSNENVSKLCAECKVMLIEALGLHHSKPPTSFSTTQEEGAGEYAELGLQAARAFLLGCNEKTRQVLQLISDSGESFSIHQLENQMEVERQGLRGVWGGLTKRTRTITGDPDAALIDWDDRTNDGDYIGRLTPTTLGSFKRALAE